MNLISNFAFFFQIVRVRLTTGWNFAAMFAHTTDSYKLTSSENLEEFELPLE